jgi:hypothetical protein
MLVEFPVRVLAVFWQPKPAISCSILSAAFALTRRAYLRATACRIRSIGAFGSQVGLCRDFAEGAGGLGANGVVSMKISTARWGWMSAAWWKLDTAQPTADAMPVVGRSCISRDAKLPIHE